MAGVKFGVEFNPRIFDSISQIGRVLPEVRARALGWVGAQGVRLLYSNFLQGQAIRLKSRRDKRGRRTVSYSVGKRAQQVSISSYPMNLFERGRLLRSGRREPGKHVILGRFKTLMNSSLQSIVDSFDDQHLQKILNDVERDIAAGREISRQGYLK
jgi:hypothetical protein